jgi:hypothetical protein
MATPWEWLQKYLVGQAPVGDFDTVERSRGLFGVGGDFGQGGLLTNFQSNPAAMESLGNTFSNPLVLGALRGLQSGAKGQTIMQAAPEAIIGGVKDAYTVGKFKKFQKEKKVMEKLLESDEISDINKMLISIGKNPLPEKKGSFEKKVEYITDNSPFNKNEVIGMLVKDKDKWSKKRFVSETYTRTVGLSGHKAAEKAANEAGKFWDLNFESSAPGSTVDLSVFSITDKAQGNHKDIQSLIEATKVQSDGTFSDQEVIEFLLKNNWITRN